MAKISFKFWDADTIAKAKAENAIKTERAKQSKQNEKKSAAPKKKPAVKNREKNVEKGAAKSKKNFEGSFEKLENQSVLSALFENQKIEREIFENFDKIVQDVAPVPAAKLSLMPHTIHELSLLLTAEREDFRAGYMNESKYLAAYSRYFLWWNILRLSSVLSALNADFFAPLDENGIILDAGSGPLTAPISLWLSRPDLREKNLTVYCVDTSRAVLDVGEGIFAAICAKFEDCAQNWKIIKVRDDFSNANLRQKAGLIVCANAFNEISGRTRALDALLKNCAKKSSVFIAEPGTPISAIILTRARQSLFSKNFSVVSPCPHAEKCPMIARGPKRKWCHFSIDAAETAPPRLKFLSEKSHLPKDRATISFLAATNCEVKKSKSLQVRLISEPIRLENATGRYGCCAEGLVLVVGRAAEKCNVGDLISVPSSKFSEIDEKSGATVIRT